MYNGAIAKTIDSTDIKLVVWIGGLELVARPFFFVVFYF